MDEDEIVEDGIVEQETTDPLDSYRREQLTFEEVASRDEFQSADVTKRLEIVDKLSAYNKGLYDGVEAESDISNIEAKTQLQKRLITSDYNSKNGPEWTKEIHKSQYEAYAGFYDSDHTDYDFDIMEHQLNEGQEKLAMGKMYETLDPLKYTTEPTVVDGYGQESSGSDIFKAAEEQMGEGDLVYLGTEDYYNNTEDGYNDPAMPQLDDTGEVNNVTRMKPADELAWVNKVVDDMSELEGEELTIALTESGATPSQITKRTRMGLLSLNSAQYLMKSLYGDTVLSSEYGSEQDFDGFLNKPGNEEVLTKYQEAINRYETRNENDAPLLAQPLVWLGNSAVDFFGDETDAAELKVLQGIQDMYAQDWVMRNKDKPGVTRQDMKDAYSTKQTHKWEQQLGVTGFQKTKEAWRNAIQNAFGSSIGIAGQLGSFVARYGGEYSEAADKMLKLNTDSWLDWTDGIYTNFATLDGPEQKLNLEMETSLQKWQMHADNKPTNMTAKQQQEWVAKGQELVAKLAKDSYTLNKDLFGVQAGNLEDYDISKVPSLMVEAAMYAETANPDNLVRLQSILRVGPQTRVNRDAQAEWTKELGMEGMNSFSAGVFGGVTAGWQEAFTEAASLAIGAKGAQVILKAKKARKIQKALNGKAGKKATWRDQALFDANQATTKAKVMRAAGKSKYVAAAAPQVLSEGAEEGFVELGNPDITNESFKHAVKQGLMGGAGLGAAQVVVATPGKIRDDLKKEANYGKLTDDVMSSERKVIVDNLRASGAPQTAKAVEDSEVYTSKDASKAVDANLLESTNDDVTFVELSGRHEEALESYEKAKEASLADPENAELKEQLDAETQYTSVLAAKLNKHVAKMVESGKIKSDSATTPSQSETPVSDTAPTATTPTTPKVEKTNSVENLSETAETKLENENDEANWLKAKEKRNIVFGEGRNKETAESFKNAAEAMKQEIETGELIQAYVARNEAKLFAQKQRARAAYHAKQGNGELSKILIKEAEMFESIAQEATTEQESSKTEEAPVVTEQAQPAKVVRPYKLKRGVRDTRTNPVVNNTRDARTEVKAAEVVSEQESTKQTDTQQETEQVDTTTSEVIRSAKGLALASKGAATRALNKHIKANPGLNKQDYKVTEITEGKDKGKYEVRRVSTPEAKTEVNTDSNTKASKTSVKGVNIYSKSKSKLGRMLTNPYKSKFKYKMPGSSAQEKVYESAEHMYQTWKTGEYNDAAYKLKGRKYKAANAAESAAIRKNSKRIMRQVLKAKLELNPEVEQAIDEAGGVEFLNASQHKVSGRDAFWETTDTGRGEFMTALTEVYQDRKGDLGAVEELDDATRSLKDTKTLAKGVLSSGVQTESQDSDAFMSMLQSVAPGLDVSKVDTSFKAGESWIGVVPYEYADGSQADKYTLKISPTWRTDVARALGFEDYNTATAQQRKLAEVYVARALDEEARHIALFQRTTAQERAEMTKDLLSDDQARSELETYFRNGELEKRKGEETTAHERRIVAEWSNIVAQRSVYGFSNSDFINWIRTHSEKIRTLTKRVLKHMMESLKLQQKAVYSPRVQTHLDKIESIFNEVMGDVSSRALNVTSNETVKSKPIAPAKVKPPTVAKVSESVQTLQNVNEYLRAIQKANTSTIDGAFGITTRGDIVLRVPEEMIIDAHNESQNQTASGQAMPSLSDVNAAIENINKSGVFSSALSTVSAFGARLQGDDTVDTVFSNYKEALQRYNDSLKTLNSLTQQEAETGVGLTVDVEGETTTDLQKEIPEQAAVVERAHYDLLVAKNQMPSEFIRAYKDIVSLSKLTKSTPSFEYLGSQGVALGDSIEAGLEREWLRDRMTQAVQPMIKYLREYRLNPFIGKSSRNHAPSKALIYFNDGNLSLEQLGYLMNTKQEAKIYVAPSPRMAADLLGLRERIVSYIEAQDVKVDDASTVTSSDTAETQKDIVDNVAFSRNRDKQHARLIERIDTILASVLGDSKVALTREGLTTRINDLTALREEAVNATGISAEATKRKLAVIDQRLDKLKEIESYYEQDVKGTNNFGRSIFFIRGDNTLVKEGKHKGKIAYELDPPHLKGEEDLSDRFNKKRAANVRYTVASSFSVRARIATNLGILSMKSNRLIKSGNPLAPLSIPGNGKPSLNPAGSSFTDVIDSISRSIETRPETNSKLLPPIPFPSMQSSSVEVKWARNIKAMFSKVKAQNLTANKASLHPVSAYANDILILANRYIADPTKYNKNNLTQRVKNVSDLISEIKKQTVNQEKTLKETRIDTDMLERMSEQMTFGNLTNISPVQLEAILDRNTNVDAATAVIYEEGGASTEQFTNRDDAVAQEEFNELARIHGLDYNSTEKDAAQKRSLMLAVLFDLDIQNALDWASQFKDIQQLDQALFERLDHEVETYMRHNATEERTELAALMGGSVLVEGMHSGVMKNLSKDRETSKSELQRMSDWVDSQLEGGGWSRATIADIIAAEQSSEAIMGLTGKGSYGKVAMAKLSAYIEKYNLDMRFVNGYLRNGRELYNKRLKLSLRGHLIQQTESNQQVASNIMGMLRAVRRARTDVSALKQERSVYQARLANMKGEDVTTTENVAPAVIETIRDHILTLPVGKVSRESYKSIFGNQLSVSGLELTPKELMANVLSEKYGDVTVIIYDGSGLSKQDLAYMTNHVLLDANGDVQAILMDRSNSQFETPADKVVSQLLTHALKTGVTEQDANALNDLKRSLDQYFRGDFNNTDVAAEVEALSEMTKGQLAESTFDDYTQRSQAWRQRQLDTINPDLAKMMGWAQESNDATTRFSDIPNSEFLMQVLFDQRLRHYAGTIASQNPVFESLLPFVSSTAIAEAATFIDTMSTNVLSGSAQINEEQVDGNLEQEDMEEANLGQTRVNDGYGLAPGTSYESTYFAVDNTTSPLTQVVAMAIDIVRRGTKSVSKVADTDVGLRAPQSQASGDNISVADFYDYSANAKQKNSRLKTAKAKIWTNLVDKTGNAYRGVLKLTTAQDKWRSIQRGSGLRPRIGSVSSTEQKVYDDAYKAAKDAYNGLFRATNRLRDSQAKTQSAVDTYEQYPETKDASYRGMLVDLDRLNQKLAHAEAQLNAGTMEVFATKAAEEAAVKVYETRMLEKQQLQKNAAKNSQLAPAPITPASLYKSSQEMSIKLNQGVNSILEQSNREFDAMADNLTLNMEEEASYPTMEPIAKPAVNTKSTYGNKVTPAKEGSKEVPAHSDVPSVSGLTRSPEAKVAGDNYTATIKQRAYNDNALYRSMMDEDVNSEAAIAVNGLIATVADIATNSKFTKADRKSANDALQRFVDGDMKGFTQRANMLRSHSSANSNIEQVIDGINVKAGHGVFTHQDVTITRLFMKSKKAFKHGLMMLAEQDFGVYGNAGRNNWKRLQTAIVESLTRFASKAGTELSTRAYVGALITNVAPDSKATHRQQITRNITAVINGSAINQANKKFLDRETLQLTEYAQKAALLAEKWLAKQGDVVDAADLYNYTMVSLGTGARAKAARSMVEKSISFFESKKHAMQMMAQMRGKRIGSYDRYLPIRGFDVGANPMDGMDGVEDHLVGEMQISRSQERSRFEFDDQTRGLDFNPLRALLAGTNATLYHLNTFDAMNKAENDFGAEGVDSQYNRNANANSTLTLDQKNAVNVMNNRLRNEVERQRHNDVSHSIHTGKVMNAAAKLSTMGYRTALTSLSQVVLQTVPVIISYVALHPVKGVRLMHNMARMLGSTAQGQANSLFDTSMNSYMEDLSNLIKTTAPELYARSLDGITELQDKLSKMNMTEIKGVGDLATAGVANTVGAANKMYDILLHLSTGAPDTFVIRALYATEYEMSTGKRIDSNTALSPDRAAAVTARVESEARMAQSDSSKKAKVFQPVETLGALGYSMELMRKMTLVFGNHLLSLSPRVMSGIKMLGTKDMKWYGTKIVADYTMQVALFNALKIRNLAALSGLILVTKPDDEEELEKLSKQALDKKADPLTGNEKKRLTQLQNKFKQYEDRLSNVQNSILETYHTIPATGDVPKAYTSEDLIYSLAVKSGVELMGGLASPLAIPTVNGEVLSLAKDVTSALTGTEYRGQGSERHLDPYTDRLRFAGAPGIALTKMLNTVSTYAHAQKDYEFGRDDLAYLALTFGGARESQSSYEKTLRKRNDTFAYLNSNSSKQKSSPELFSSLPHQLRFHKPMERPAGVADYSLKSHPSSSVTLDMFEGMDLHEVDMVNRPWNDGDSAQFSKGILDSSTYRFLGIDTLETTAKSKDMRNRIYQQSIDTGIYPVDIMPTGKKQSYITQNAIQNADKVWIATTGNVAFSRDIKSQERVDALVLIQKDGVIYEHGLSMAMNGDARVTGYGLSNLPKSTRDAMKSKYAMAKQMADSEATGTMYKKPKTTTKQVTSGQGRTLQRNMDILKRLRSK